MDQLSQVNNLIAQFNGELEILLDDSKYKSTLLSRKYVSQLTNKIYILIENGAKNSQQNKDILLRVFQSHCTNFINNKIIYELVKCSQDAEFVSVLVFRWENYKRFVFIYYTLLLHAKDYYEMAFLNQKNNQSQVSKHNLAIMPVPALGVHLFQGLILRRFASRIRRSVLQLLKQQRQKMQPSETRLRTIFQLIWSCSLLSIARIKYSKEAICFYKEQRQQMTAHYRSKQNSDSYLHAYIMQEVLHSVANHYCQVYEHRLRLLNPFQQIQHILRCCRLQQAIATYHFVCTNLMQEYKQAIYKELILSDIDAILNRSNGFKFLLRNFQYQSEEYLPQIIAYFQVISLVQEHLIEPVIKIVTEVISEKGAEINLKMGKSRQHVSEMLNFKKSIRRIFQVVPNKFFKIQMATERCFKQLLDGLQVSKNLAEFTDFTIKECSRLKLDEQACETRFKDLLFLLNSLSAKDSYFIHHQQLLSKRLLDSFMEPKIQIETSFLKLLAEQLGNIMVAPHFSMLKDIESSTEFTQQFGNKFPFIQYKWGLRVINSMSWPDSCSKRRFKHIQAPLYLQMHLSQLQQYYHQKFDYRFLSWKLERGTSMFEGTFSRGKYRFQAENIYMMILLHIAEQQGYSILFGNLKKLIEDNKEEGQKASPLTNYLKVLIESQIIKRHALLLDQPFSAGEQLAINMSYAPSQSLKPGQAIIIRPSQQMMKMFHHNSIEHGKILKERQKLIEAVLVKLLKHAHSTGNNSISFSELFKGVREHSFLGNFNFSEAVVKQRLEQLISKEYCARDEKDRKIYHYIA